MTKKRSPGFIAIVNDAKSRVKELDVHEVHNMLVKKEPFYFVDVREESEWAESRLPNAIHLSKGAIERDIEQEVNDKDAKIVLYCGGGSRSALSADNLQKMGYNNVISMCGGFRGWRDAGYPVDDE